MMMMSARPLPGFSSAEALGRRTAAPPLQQSYSVATVATTTTLPTATRTTPVVSKLPCLAWLGGHSECQYRRARSALHVRRQNRTCDPPTRVRRHSSLCAVLSSPDSLHEEAQKKLDLLLRDGQSPLPSVPTPTPNFAASTGRVEDHSDPADLLGQPPVINLAEDSETEFIETDTVQGGTSTYEEALSNAVNILLGVGLLSIPFALREGGWSSAAVFAGLWATTLYTGKILAKCQQYPIVASNGSVSSPLQTYEDIGELAFGGWGRAFISTVLYVELIGTCGLFFILEGDHLALLFDGASPQTLMLLSAPILIGTSWLGDLSKLAPLGRVGALASIALTGVIGYEWWSSPADTSMAETALLHLETFPLTFGLAAFVYAGHAVFPSIYSSMKEPERYEEMLTTAYSIVGVVCLAIGFAGYSLYGDGSEQEITLNLPTGLLATVATSLIVVNPCTKFALTLDPVAKFFESKLERATTSSDTTITPTARKAVRTSLGLACLYLATSVPNFAYVMSLIGSFLTMIVSVIFPSCCYLKLYDDQLEDSEKAMNGIVIFVGALCAISGTWSAVAGVVSQ